MAKRRVRFTFPQDIVPRPIIFELTKGFDVVTNIRRADVGEDRGWVVLELEGEAGEIERSLKWASEQGVAIDPIPGDAADPERRNGVV